ncbi:MAG: mechanosensitive ion channel [Clostridia bacterium]|nr:mechanosensitive ion channel [Clostridia bacterium]
MKLLQEQGMKLFAGLLVLAVGLFAAHWIVKLMERSRKFIRIEPTLRGFLENLARLLLYVTVVLTAAGVMGIPMTSFVTLLASAGVAVSLAMQGALGNFVGGVTMLLLKPFKAGDYVKIGDTEGTAKVVGVSSM